MASDRRAVTSPQNGEKTYFTSETAPKNGGRPPKILPYIETLIGEPIRKELTESQYMEIVAGLFEMSLDGLARVAEGGNTPAFMVALASAIRLDTMAGKLNSIEWYFNRSFGMAKSRMEHGGGDGSPLFPAGAVMVNILGAGAKPITNENDLPEDDEFYKIDE